MLSKAHCISLVFYLTLVALASSSLALAVEYQVGGNPLLYSPEALRSSLQVPLQIRPLYLSVPRTHLRDRTELHTSDPRIEPVYVFLPKPLNKSIHEFAQNYARSPKYFAALKNYLTQRPAGVHQTARSTRSRRSPERVAIIINSNALKLIDPEKLAQRTRTKTYDLRILKSHSRAFFEPSKHPLLSSLPSRFSPHQQSPSDKLLSQTKNFLDRSTWRRLRQKITRGDSLRVSEDLLPPFAQKMNGHYSLFRGPNCFHTAMAFQDPALISMGHTNLREEKHHHSLMINHDELWHILNWYFYEINPATTELNYGDVVVFLDVPEAHLTSSRPPEHRWIVHASAYLFEGYVFSKSSKSPNTPYSIKTLNEEWAAWKKRTNHLAIKVYRRSFENLRRKSPVVSRTSWLY